MPLFRGIWRSRPLVFAGLALLLYLVGLGRPPLWEPDEGRYAEIAREMVVNHDYVTPRNNFVRYFEKPPLVYWVTAASLKILGRNEFAVRLQAAIASAGQVAITGLLAERMFGASAGALAALALALSPLFFAFARFATPDPALSLFLTASMACFYKGTQLLEPRRRIDGRWVVAAAAMLALGTLTKGLVALALGGAIAILWMLAEGRVRDALRLPWLGSIAVYLALTLPWFIVVAQRNPGFLNFFIIHEHFERYVASTEHGWGAWFYVPITIAGTWPWCYFVVLGLPAFSLLFMRSPGPDQAPEHKAQTVAEDSTDKSSQAALRFLLIWFGVILVFFSIPRSKLGEYILPGLPPIAILAGRGLARIDRLSVAERRRVLIIFAAINAAAAIAIVSALTLTSAYGFGDILAFDAVIAAVALLISGAAPLVGDGKFVHVAPALAFSMILMMAAGNDARHRVAARVSYRNLARIIGPYTDRGCRLMSYRHFEQALPFYTGARETLVNYRGELQPFGPRQDANGYVFATDAQLKQAWAGEGCVVLVTNGRDLAELINLLSPQPALLGCEGKKLALSNRPPDPPLQIPGECLTGHTKSSASDQKS